MNIYKILLVTSYIYYGSSTVNYINYNGKKVPFINSRLSSLDHIPSIDLGEWHAVKSCLNGGRGKGKEGLGGGGVSIAPDTQNPINTTSKPTEKVWIHSHSCLAIVTLFHHKFIICFLAWALEFLQATQLLGFFLFIFRYIPRFSY